jgi:hypothetical protein
MYDQAPEWTLFSLVPMNDAAKKAAEHPWNNHLVWNNKGELALAIGSNTYAPPGTLAILGRHKSVSVHIADAFVSRFQCSFEVHPETKAVMLHDNSVFRTTHVKMQQKDTEEVFQFLQDRPRRIALCEKSRIEIMIGVDTAERLLFELVWAQKVATFMAQASMQNQQGQVDPRLAQSVDITASQTPRLAGQTLSQRTGPQIRYNKLEEIGSGTYSKVHKAINIDTGVVMAVKRISRKPLAAHAEVIRQEIETLSRCRHVGHSLALYLEQNI